MALLLLWWWGGGMQSGARNNNNRFGGISSNGCHEMIRELAFMINHEPSVQSALRQVQAFCLVGGIQLKYGGTTPPTPRFTQHLNKNFIPFCRDVIESFLTVGFAPYRIRKSKSGAQIPELLPLGTYTWHVARNMNNMGGYMKEEDPFAGDNSKKRKREAATVPFLQYEINSMYCEDPVHVHVFIPPQALFLCSSPLASLLACYGHLLNKRECAYRADQFNSQPSLIMEKHTKIPINAATEKGMSLTATENKGNEGDIANRRSGNMKMMHDVMDTFAHRTHLPPEAVMVMVPSEHAVHSLDRVLSPQEMLREELSFTRQVALSCGIPCAMLLQGGGSIGASATSASNTNAWAEGIEGSNRLFLDTCRNINSHLECMLYDIYSGIYGINHGHAPVFKLPLVPTIPFEQLMIAHEAQLVDDKCFSRMLEATWGVGLSKDADGVRAQKQKAEFVLPFKDKKTDAKK